MAEQPRQRERLQAVLAEARPTEERITWDDMRTIVAQHQSQLPALTLVFLGILSVLISGSQILMLIEREPRHPLFSDALSYLLVGFALLSVYCGTRQLIE